MLAIEIDLRKAGKAIIFIIVKGYSPKEIEYLGKDIEVIRAPAGITYLKIDGTAVANFPSESTYVLK